MPCRRQISRPRSGKNWSSIAALTPCARLQDDESGKIADVPEGWPFLDGVVDEIVAVAARKNIPLDRDEARAFLRSVSEEARNHEPSMLVDIRAGRATEIECLNGAVLRECERYELPAPHNRALYAMIRVLEQIAGRRGP
jgi:2-dehydropantoate 2-reductase